MYRPLILIAFLATTTLAKAEEGIPSWDTLDIVSEEADALLAADDELKRKMETVGLSEDQLAKLLVERQDGARRMQSLVTLIDEVQAETDARMNKWAMDCKIAMACYEGVIVTDLYIIVRVRIAVTKAGLEGRIMQHALFAHTETVLAPTP